MIKRGRLELATSPIAKSHSVGFSPNYRLNNTLIQNGKKKSYLLTSDSFCLIALQIINDKQIFKGIIITASIVGMPLTQNGLSGCEGYRQIRRSAVGYCGE